MKDENKRKQPDLKKARADKNIKVMATLYALLAAALYAVNIPLSKFPVEQIGSAMTASLLYLGAGFGMAVLELVKSKVVHAKPKEHLTKKELPYTVAMVVLDIAAPILLMAGIGMTSSANVSLLNNFEIVATSIIALTIYKERISKKLWAAIIMVTAASAVLSFEEMCIRDRPTTEREK